MEMKTLSDWLDGVTKVLVVGLGGGGDAISAYPSIKYLRDAGKEVLFANIHVSSNPDNFKNFAKLSIGKAAFILEQQPINEKLARCMEIITQSELNLSCFSCLSNYGVNELANSLELIIKANNIDGVFSIDGGTDSMAALDTKITSIINDALALAALSKLSFSNIPLGIIGCCADLEMDLNKFMEKFSVALKSRAYMGVIDFPIKEYAIYQSLITKAKKEFSFFVCESVLKSSSGEFGFFTNCYNQSIPLYPFQLFTYVFDSEFVSNVLNPFVTIIKETNSFNEAKSLLTKFLDEALPGKSWEKHLNE